MNSYLRNGLLFVGAAVLLGAILGVVFVLMSMAIVHDSDPLHVFAR